MIAYKFLSAGRNERLHGVQLAAAGRRPRRLGRGRGGALPERHPRLPHRAPSALGRQTLYEVELDGEIVEDRTKLVASRARLAAPDRGVGGRRCATSYTRMCADRAHELTRDASPALEQWEAAIEPSIREGPALLGFMAARIAEEIAGPEAYHAERARQTAWLVEQLRLGA